MVRKYILFVKLSLIAIGVSLCVISTVSSLLSVVNMLFVVNSPPFLLYSVDCRIDGVETLLPESFKGTPFQIIYFAPFSLNMDFLELRYSVTANCFLGISWPDSENS